MARSLLSSLAAIGMVAAGAGILAPAALSAQSSAPVAEARDFECFVLLQQRREGISANAQLAPEQRAQIVNNLTIISAFYAGIISRAPYHAVMANLAAARANVAGGSAEQRDAFAAQCTNRYLSMLDALLLTISQPGNNCAAVGWPWQSRPALCDAPAQYRLFGL